MNDELDTVCSELRNVRESLGVLTERVSNLIHAVNEHEKELTAAIQTNSKDILALKLWRSFLTGGIAVILFFGGWIREGIQSVLSLMWNGRHQ